MAGLEPLLTVSGASSHMPLCPSMLDSLCQRFPGLPSWFPFLQTVFWLLEGC